MTNNTTQASDTIIKKDSNSGGDLLAMGDAI